jgi:hypothetical protein
MALMGQRHGEIVCWLCSVAYQVRADDLSRRIVTAVTARTDSIPVEHFEVLPWTQSCSSLWSSIGFYGEP